MRILVVGMVLSILLAGCAGLPESPAAVDSPVVSPLTITKLSVETPAFAKQPMLILVHTANRGTTAELASVALFVDGQRVDRKDALIPAGGTATTQFSYLFPFFGKYEVNATLDSGGSSSTTVEVQRAPSAATPPRSAATPPPAPSPRGPIDRGDFRVQWPEATDATYRDVRTNFIQTRVFEDLLDAFNSILALPHDILVSHEECGMANAFYLPDKRAIAMCYELMTQIAETMVNIEMTEEELAQAISSAWMFIFFHEMGHALVDAYDLPITGREEDSVDDLATLVLIDLGESDAAMNAAIYWHLASPDASDYSNSDFADEHSLSPQRFYSIMCLVYGSDLQAYAWVVSGGHLPEARAARCEHEYQQKDAAWSRLLEPWLVGRT